MAEQVIKWSAKDGALYDTEAEAITAEAKLTLLTALTERLGANYSLEQVVYHLLDDRSDFPYKAVLKEIPPV